MKLLLVEDDKIVRITVRDALEEAGDQVTACSDGTTALRALENEPFDIVLTDVRLPGLSGIDLFRRLRQLQPGAAVLLMTAYTDTDDAVAVMREGARDYIAKPFEIDELLLRLARVRREVSFRKEMETGGRSSGSGSPILGTSPAMLRLLERVAVAAASDAGVLITGETGTGKDLCARSIHERSRRAGMPFVAVNCAAIPENLFEAELFGHEKGAFTGADRRRIGRFEAANGGTLFLDEIGELSPGSQVKILRAIETSTFEPVGSSRSVHVDVRLISATNRDLTEKAAFRRDLFYRLNVIDVLTPPLRQCRTDVPLLVAAFLTEIAGRHGQPVPVLDPSAFAALATHDYPGNVRELMHALERAFATARGGPIRGDHLPLDMVAAAHDGGAMVTASSGAQLEPLVSATGQFERQYIDNVLEKVGGHRGQAAAVLGISRKALWQRLREPPK